MTRIRHIYDEEAELGELLKGCRKKDPHFQKRLFEKYASLIFTTCRRYNTSWYPAKDLLQDTFIKVFDKIHQFDPRKGKLESWIRRIAINLALNAIRDKKMTFVEAKMDIPQEEENPAFQGLSEEKILGLIGELPVGYKTVFNLYVIDGYSHKEIASQLNISLSTSKTQLFKAKRILQEKIITLKKKSYGGF